MAKIYYGVLEARRSFRWHRYKTWKHVRISYDRIICGDFISAIYFRKQFRKRQISCETFKVNSYFIQMRAAIESISQCYKKFNSFLFPRVDRRFWFILFNKTFIRNSSVSNHETINTRKKRIERTKKPESN